MDRQLVEPATGHVELGVPGGVVDRPALVAPAAEIPVVVLGRPRLVVGEQARIRIERHGGGRAGRGSVVGWSDRRTAFCQRLPQPPAEEAVVASLADAIGTELRPAFEIVRPAAGVRGPAPQTVERGAERHGLSVATYGPTGVQDPNGAISTNASGSKISASSSMPSMTRGPGRLK